MSKGYDWERIEADYRSGKYTLRELSRLHGPTNQSISKRAKVKGWQKDLTEAVAQATKAAVIAQQVADRAAEAGGKLADAVQVAATINADVIVSHKRGIGKLKALVEQLGDELASASKAAAVLAPEEILSIAEAKGVEPADVTNLLMATQVASRANVADKLAGAYAKLVPLERKAHGLDKDDEASKGSLFDEWVRKNLRDES